jgi:hypothetical protein
VVRLERYGCYTVGRYAQVRAVLEDPETFCFLFRRWRRLVELPARSAVASSQPGARSRALGGGTRARPAADSPEARGPVKTLFAGVLRCAVCGGPMTAIRARRYGCHARSKVEEALLSVVREDLLAPDVLATVARTVQTAVREAAEQHTSRAHEAPARSTAL